MWTRAPSENTATEVEPPPMSTQMQPSSISSSSRADRAEQNGAATAPSNCRWARSTQWPRVLKAVSAMETTSSSRPSTRPNMERGSRTPFWASTAQDTGRRWIGRRPGVRIWATAAAMAREQSASVIGRAPTETELVTRQLCSWPPEVATVTPEIETPAMASARSTAWAMASTASSGSTITPARTPRDWT